MDPDERLLVPPSPETDTKDDHKDLRVVGKSFGQKVSAEAHHLVDKAVKAEKAVEKKAVEAFDWFRHDWVHFGVAVAIITLAIHSLHKNA